LAAETRDCSTGGTEPTAVSGGTWYAQYAGAIALGLNFPGEILQLPGLLLLTLLHVEDINRKLNILKPSSFARKTSDQLKMFSSLQWLIVFHFYIKLILIQLQFSNLHEQKQSFETSFVLSLWDICILIYDALHEHFTLFEFWKYCFFLTLDYNGTLDYLVTFNTFDTLPGAVFLCFICKFNWSPSRMSSGICRILKVLLGI
jgi:hypothetical protein